MNQVGVYGWAGEVCGMTSGLMIFLLVLVLWCDGGEHLSERWSDMSLSNATSSRMSLKLAAVWLPCPEVHHHIACQPPPSEVTPAGQICRQAQLSFWQTNNEHCVNEVSISLYCNNKSGIWNHLQLANKRNLEMPLVNKLASPTQAKAGVWSTW